MFSKISKLKWWNLKWLIESISLLFQKECACVSWDFPILSGHSTGQCMRLLDMIWYFPILSIQVTACRGWLDSHFARKIGFIHKSVIGKETQIKKKNSNFKKLIEDRVFSQVFTVFNGRWIPIFSNIRTEKLSLFHIEPYWMYKGLKTW